MRKFTAIVNEFDGGQPWVRLELTEDIGLGRRQIALYFAKGTEITIAEEVARVLNSNVEAVGLAGF